MGRWSFEGGSPLYIPDEGEEGGGSMLGHLGMGIGSTLGDMGNALAGAADFPGIKQGLNALAMPQRAVTATGHALAGSTGKTDPLDFIMTGEREDPEDLAGYGDLLADTMEAEGTINEQGLAAKAIRDVGNLISDPLVLFGAARGVAKMASGGRPAPRSLSNTGEMPRSRLSPNQPRPMDTTPGQAGGGPQFPRGGGGAGMETGEMGWTQVAPKRLGRAADTGALRRGLMEGAEDVPGAPKLLGEGKAPGGGGVSGGPGSPRPRTRYRQPPADRPSAASQWPSVPLDADLASPGAFTTGGAKNLPRARNVPPAAARPLDADLATGRGGVGNLPRTKNAKALDRATGRMKKEQLGEGEAAMRTEQARQDPMLATQPIPIASQGPMAAPMPRDALRAMIQAAVENGASADDVMKLLSNLGG